MKKLRTLLFSSVPLLLAFAIQMVAMLYLLLIAAIFLVADHPSQTDINHTMMELIEVSVNMEFTQVVYIVFSVSCIICFGLWYIKRCGGKLNLDIRKSFHPLELLGIVFLIPGTQYLSSIVTAMVGVIFPNWLEAYEELIETAGIGEEISLLMMIYTVCLAPISEELIFRGVTLRVAQRAFPFWIANIIQAFLFGAFHMNMLQGCYTFILGLFLGYICEKGGSIYHVIIFHFLFNLWGTTIAEWLVVEDATLQGIIIIVGTIIGLTLGLYFFQKGNQKKKIA